MLKTIIVLFALIAIVYSQDTSNACPDGTQPYSCFQDPCQITPQGCDVSKAKCVADYCGGCNAHWYNSDGREICIECPTNDCGPQLTIPSTQCTDGSVSGPTGRCIKEPGAEKCHWEIAPPCPPSCPGVICAMFCPYGNKLDKDGCPICECNELDCSNAVCTAVACSEGEIAVKDPNSCCPKCVKDCSQYACIQLACEPNQEEVYVGDSCCPSCQPASNCSAVQCLKIDSCPTGTVKKQGECCEYCEPVLNCAVVLCAAVECGDGEKPYVPEGECCPKCKKIPDCTDTFCTQVECQPGYHKEQSDYSCCPVCIKDDWCDFVDCARPECETRGGLTIIREGSCCPQCSFCKETDQRLCNGNDDPVCKPGYYKEDENGNCIEIPPTDRIEKSISIKICPCSDLTVAQIKAKVSNAVGDILPIEHFTIEFGGSEGDCCKATVKITATKGETFDPIQASILVEQALQSDSEIKLYSTGSSASIITISGFLIALSFIVMLF